MQYVFSFVEPEMTTRASTPNTIGIPHCLQPYIRRLPDRIQHLGALLARILSFAICVIREGLTAFYDFAKDSKFVGEFVKQLADRCYNGHGSQSPWNPTLENKEVSRYPANRSEAIAFTSKQPCGDGQGCGGSQAQQKVDNPLVHADIPTSSNHQVNTVIMNPANNFICATQFASATSMTENAPMPGQIALNLEQNAIYRFDPSKTITVSIDWVAFSAGGIKEPLSVQLLQKGLEYNVAIINHLRLGIRFEVCCSGQVGLVQLKYCQDSTVQYNVQRSISWAETEFPRPGVNEYTIWIRAPTFWHEYVSSIPNILSHEFGHLMGMRHWNAEKDEAPYPSIQYPPGDYDDQSIMGRFDHPCQLYFHKKDIEWLRKFYAKKEGEQINGKTIKDLKSIDRLGTGVPVRPS